MSLPRVIGGTLHECVGGPLDGEVVFMPAGEVLVNVGHWYDAQRTAGWLGIRPGSDNYLGYYSPMGLGHGAPAVWRCAEVQAAR